MSASRWPRSWWVWTTGVAASLLAGIGVNAYAHRRERQRAIEEATRLFVAADTLSRHGDYKDARVVYQQMVDLLADKDAPAGVAEGLNGMAIADLNLGTPQEIPNEAQLRLAVSEFNAAIPLFREAGYVYRAGAALEKRALAYQYLADIRDRAATFRRIVVPDLLHAYAIFNDSLPEAATDRVCLLNGVNVSLTSAYAELAKAGDKDWEKAVRQVEVFASAVMPDDSTDDCPDAPYWPRAQINRVVAYAGAAENGGARWFASAIALLDTVARTYQPDVAPDDYLIVIRNRAELYLDRGLADHRLANMQAAIADAATARRYTPDAADYLLTSKWKWIDGAAKAYIADLHGDAAAWLRAVASLDSTSAAVSPRDAPVEAALLEERLATLKASSVVSEHVARADDRAIAAALQVLTADQYPHQFARLMAAKHQLLVRTMDRAGLSPLVDSLQGVTSLPTPFSSGDRADQLRVLGCAHLKVGNDSAAIDAFLRSAALYATAGRLFDRYRTSADAGALAVRRRVNQISHDSASRLLDEARMFFANEGATPYSRWVERALNADGHVTNCI